MGKTSSFGAGLKTALTKLSQTKFNIRVVFMVMAMLMWATSFIVDLINPSYNPPDYVNPMIMLVGGYLFATSNRERKSTGYDHDSKMPEVKESE